MFYFFKYQTFPSPPLRHGVVTAASPGMTSQNAPDGEIQSFYRSVFHYCLTGIFGACGCEAA